MKKPAKSTVDAALRKWVNASCTCVARGEAGIRCSQRIETCHLKSRRHGAIRWSPLNVVPMCNAHHRYFTEHPDFWTAFIERTYPGRWDALNQRLIEARDNGEKPDPCYWLEWLRSRTDSWKEWAA